MATLIRFVGSFAAWDEQHVDRAVADFSLREGELGVSVWQVTEDAQRELIVAARALQKQRIEKMDFVEFDCEIAARFGVIAPTDGNSPLLEINDLHRELQWPKGTLDEFARHLLDTGVEPRRRTKTQVRSILKTIDPARVDAVVREWLRAQQ